MKTRNRNGTPSQTAWPSGHDQPAPAQDGGDEIYRAYGIDPYKLYPVSHVAALLSVDVKQVQGWLRRGLLEGIKLPSHAWRIRGIEVVRILEQGKRRRRGAGATTLPAAAAARGYTERAGTDTEPAP